MRRFESGNELHDSPSALLYREQQRSFARQVNRKPSRIRTSPHQSVRGSLRVACLDPPLRLGESGAKWEAEREREREKESRMRRWESGGKKNRKIMKEREKRKKKRWKRWRMRWRGGGEGRTDWRSNRCRRLDSEQPLSPLRLYTPHSSSPLALRSRVYPSNRSLAR